MRQPTTFKKAKLKRNIPKNKTLEELVAESKAPTGPFKPMKPFTITNPEMLDYPVACTPKIDGIRSVTYKGGTPMSYSLKPIPNLHIRKVLEDYGVKGMDGELFVVGATTFGESSGPIMRVDGEPDFIYYVFDMYQHHDLYMQRVAAMAELPKPRPPCIKILKPTTVYDAEGFIKYWNKCVNDGFEGVIARKNLAYVHGRSGKTFPAMGKYKHFQDDEAEIIGYEEMCTNTNPKKINAHGRSERGSAKAGKVPNGHLGKWLMRDLKTGVEFSCGTFLGVKKKERKQLWDNRQIYMGYIAKYKHQPSGETAKPRFPVWLGWRHKDDM